jgi:hypothetical protein
MSFSKNNSLPVTEQAPRFGTFGADEGDAPGSEKTGGRFDALRDLMIKWLETTVSIAAAIRENEVIALPGFSGELMADVSPLDIRPLEENFTVAHNGRAMHASFGYAVPGAPNRAVASAQPHLYQLTTRILELNVFCQRAQLTDSLRLALQAPKLPPLIDRILVGTAFFAAYFEIYAELPAGTIAKARRLVDAGEVDRMKNILDMRLLRASDAMFAPREMTALLPFKDWPFIGNETLTATHPGERFANKVYFPASASPPKVLSVLRSFGSVPN